MDEAVTKARGYLGGVIKNHPDRPDLHEHGRRNLAAANLEAYIKKVVDQCPPLTDAQRSRLAVLLQPRAVA